jgi:hypothetical protein
MAITHDPKLLTEAMQSIMQHRPLYGGPQLDWETIKNSMINAHQLEAERLRKLICMRLHLSEGEKLFEFAECHQSGDKAFLFVVHGGKALVFEEGYDLFPSDGLITQLRLLRE